ncbi:MAG: Fpg/Nei family DNA glycosylase [Methanobacterium sp.]
MPELPEVETFGRYMEKTSLNKEIEEVDLESPQLLQNMDSDDFKEKLEGKSFNSVKRHGKYLFVLLDDESWLILHFGMTGSFKYYKNNNERPRYGRLIFDFKDDSHLAFIDPRKFGKIYLTLKIQDFVKNKRLGPDALDINLKTFNQLYSKRRGSSKSALMNQHVMSGIGNIYSDEILYHAKVHPKTSFNALNDAKIKEIFNIMNEILKEAIKRDLRDESLPDSYIIPHRKRDGKCPNSNNKLKTIKISGRTAYFCPDCQKEIS